MTDQEMQSPEALQIPSKFFFDAGEDPIFELLPPSVDELAKMFPDTELSGYFQR
jgi:hypothetical protein